MRRRLRLTVGGFLIVVIAGLVTTFVLGNRPLLGLDLQGGVSVVLQPKGDPDDGALDEARNIIRRRVDALGVAEPEIVRQGDNILVQLPGIEDRDQALEVIGETAKLTFRPVIRGPGAPGAAGQPGPQVVNPDAVDSANVCRTPGGQGGQQGGSDSTDGTTVPQGGSATVPQTTVPTGEGDQTGAPAPGPPAPGESATGRLPTQDDQPPSSEPAPSSSTPASRTPATPPSAPGAGGQPAPGQQAPTVALPNQDRTGCYVLGPVGLEGSALASSDAQLGQRTGAWVVNVSIKDGQKQKANALFNACNAGTSPDPALRCTPGPQGVGRVGIVLDDAVISAPAVNEPNLPNTGFVIESFSEDEAKDLALQLRYGALPVEFRQDVNVREVSATLGDDSLEAGIISGLVGLGLVAVYMIAYYRLLGAVAILSLASSAGLLWVIIAYLGATQGLALTLAGITGIVVAVGIAVDSNVVFYEHIREDMDRGRTFKSVVSGSFRSAWRTIVAADLVSLIGAGLLYWLSIGPVRGFALYLGLSTLLDLVASYLLMRPLVLLLANTPGLRDRKGLLGLGTRKPDDPTVAGGPVAAEPT